MCGWVSPRRHLDLAQEPLGADLGGDLGPEHLERDLAVVAQVVGQEDDGHAALAQLALEGVAAGEAAFEALLQVVHEGMEDVLFRGAMRGVASPPRTFPDRATGPPIDQGPPCGRPFPSSA